MTECSFLQSSVEAGLSLDGLYFVGHEPTGLDSSASTAYQVEDTKKVVSLGYLPVHLTALLLSRGTHAMAPRFLCLAFLQ